MWSPEAVFVCALALLGRNQHNFPVVQFVEQVPAGVSKFAAGFVRDGENRIFIVTSTSAFVHARQAAGSCSAVEALREIAGVLAHEEWHLQHGPNEAGAYDAQLTALGAAGADQTGALFHNILRSKRTVAEASKRALAKRPSRQAE